MKKRIFLLVLLGWGAVAHGSGFVLETTVIGTLNQNNLFGGCMVRLSTDLTAAGFNCGDDSVVSFDCDGNINTKSQGSVNFSSGQLAFVTGYPVNIYVNDTQAVKDQLDGFCYSNRMDVSAPIGP